MGAEISQDNTTCPIGLRNCLLLVVQPLPDLFFMVILNVLILHFRSKILMYLLFEDPDGEHARRVLQRMGGGQQGGRGQDMGHGGINIPPSIANNPNIPPDIIHALQAGRLGNTVFVANVRT